MLLLFHRLRGLALNSPIRGFDAKTARNGIFNDRATFHRSVRLFWIRAGTADTDKHDGAKSMHEALDWVGITNVLYEPHGTAHEF